MRSLRWDKAAKAEAKTNDDADEEVGQHGLKIFEGIGGECKLVLIVRTDLSMNKGLSLSLLPTYLIPYSSPKPPTPLYITTKSSPRM